MGPRNYAAPVGGIKERVLTLLGADPSRWWIAKDIVRKTCTDPGRTQRCLFELFEEGIVVRRQTIYRCRKPYEYALAQRRAS